MTDEQIENIIKGFAKVLRNGGTLRTRGCSICGAGIGLVAHDSVAAIGFDSSCSCTPFDSQIVDASWEQLEQAGANDGPSWAL